MFSTDGRLPPVTPAVKLVAGLFNESLPALLAEQDAASPNGRLPNLTSRYSAHAALKTEKVMLWS